MRGSLAILIATTIVASDAQAQPGIRRMPGSMLFGSLLTDRELQDELKLTEAQIKRMQELYLQSQSPGKVIFSPWGIKELGISEGQLKQIRKLEIDNLQAMLKLRKERSQSLGGNDIRVYLQKRKEMEAALEQAKLRVLTNSQWRRFEQLRGKPYKPFGKLPARPKGKLKSDV